MKLNTPASQDIIGVDIGGTFTDLVGYRNGALVLAKP